MLMMPAATRPTPLLAPGRRDLILLLMHLLAQTAVSNIVIVRDLVLAPASMPCG